MYLIEELIGTVIKSSAIYSTKPWGNIKQADFLNQAICINTELSPFEILDKIQFIEEKIGRKRIIKWGPRKIDIDILFYDEQIIKKERLVIPHPQIERRNFVLKPMVEIASKLVHPIFKKSIEELYINSQDTLDVKLLNE